MKDIPDWLVEQRRQELERLAYSVRRHFGVDLTPQQYEYYMRHGTFGVSRPAESPGDKKKGKRR